MTKEYINKLYFEFRDSIYESLDSDVINRSNKQQLKEELLVAIDLLSNSKDVRLTTSLKNDISDVFVSEILGLGPLDSLINDPNISDILVNGYENIFIERNGLLEKSSLSFMGNEQLEEISKRIASRMGRTVDMSNPMLDARLEDGSRINIVFPPISIDGVQLSIRKFNNNRHTLSFLTESGMMPSHVANLLVIAARCRLNIIISGGTGTGKTTLLNALSEYIDPGERVVTIEDAAELCLKQPHVVRLETKLASNEVKKQFTTRDLVINSLRMRPDRILIGECRGAEAFDMLQAMNTGHAGSMTTIHANSTTDAFSRIEAMVLMANLELPQLAIRKTIVSAIDLIIQIERFPNGTRRLTNVTEVRNLEDQTPVLDTIYSFDYEKEIFSSIQKHSRIYAKSKLFGLEKELQYYGN